MQFVVIDGKPIAWRDILKMKREQRKSQRKAQLTLFELKDDRRPEVHSTPSGRYREPTPFEKED